MKYMWLNIFGRKLLAIFLMSTALFGCGGSEVSNIEVNKKVTEDYQKFFRSHGITEVRDFDVSGSVVGDLSFNVVTNINSKSFKGNIITTHEGDIPFRVLAGSDSVSVIFTVDEGERSSSGDKLMIDSNLYGYLRIVKDTIENYNANIPIAIK